MPKPHHPTNSGGGQNSAKATTKLTLARGPGGTTLQPGAMLSHGPQGNTNKQHSAEQHSQKAQDLVEQRASAASAEQSAGPHSTTT